MKKSLFIFSLLSGTIILCPDLVTASGIPTSTHTNTPGLKPASLINSNQAFKTASVCFMGYGNCGNGSIGSTEDYKIDTDQQCLNEGFVKLNCPSLREIEDVCPYNSGYGKICRCRIDLVTCSSPLVGFGEACDGKYAKCTCPDGVSVGTYGCAEYYPAPCNSVCKTVKTDNCNNRTAVNTPYGCVEYWSDCPSKCKTAYNDNCRNRSEVQTPYGCQEYWGDCQSKCRTARSKPICKVGSFYYHNGSCEDPEYAKLSLSGGVIGIVVHVTDDGKHGQIMALRSIKTDGTATTKYGSSSNSTMHWSAAELIDIPSLPNYPSSTDAAKDFNSCSNTDKIIAQGNDSEYPAAWAARKYAPSAAPETKGKWCLPAAGIFTDIQNNLAAVTYAFDEMKNYGNGDSDVWRVWTSSEIDSQFVWLSQKAYPFVKAHKSTSSNTFEVRPVLEF